jgi:hypothetical protein
LERTDLTAEQRLRLIEMLLKAPKHTGGAQKGNRPPNTGKIKKPSRNFSDADVARLRGTNKVVQMPSRAPETLGEFLKDENSPGT